MGLKGLLLAKARKVLSMLTRDHRICSVLNTNSNWPKEKQRTKSLPFFPLTLGFSENERFYYQVYKLKRKWNQGRKQTPALSNICKNVGADWKCCVQLFNPFNHYSRDPSNHCKVNWKQDHSGQLLLNIPTFWLVWKQRSWFNQEIFHFWRL